MKPKESQNMHLLHLSSQDQERYRTKLTVDGESLPDPFIVEEKLWENNVEKWPPVQYGDIWNYLVNTPGLYTADSMKAYKSLDGYNFFVSGHVQEVRYHRANDRLCYLLCSVIPSQKVTDKKCWHKTWIILDQTRGYIVSAHCTCKAGLGEACSHIAAVLFKVEAAVKLDLTNPSKTSAACVWNRYYREKVTAEPIVNIDLSKPKYGRVKKRKQPKPAPVVETCSDEEEAALQALKRICPEAGILTKDDSDTDTASDDEDMPPLVVRQHHVPKSLTEDQLMAECRQLMCDFSVTERQASNLEKMTRSQAASPLWQRQWIGRITSTVAHDVKTLKDTTDPKGCIQKVLKEQEKNLSANPSVKFGVVNERKAKNMYVEVMRRDHDCFTFRDCGLVLDTACPIFAASPDGVRNCQCHGEGLVEVKCSYKHRDKDVQDIPDMDSTFYLESGTLKLRESHRYYTQVQFQMYVCQKQFCDFVVFTNKGVFVQTVYYNPSFVHSLVQKCLTFLSDKLLPEIILRKIED